MSSRVPLKLQVHIHRDTNGWIQFWLTTPNANHYAHLGVHRTTIPNYYKQIGMAEGQRYEMSTRMAMCETVETYLGGIGVLDDIPKGTTKVITLVDPSERTATAKPKRVYRKKGSK